MPSRLTAARSKNLPLCLHKICYGTGCRGKNEPCVSTLKEESHMNLRDASDPEPCPCYPNRKGRNPRLRELDLKSLPYVRLPRAPLRWEAPSGGAGKAPEAEDSFEVRDAKWRLTAVEKLPPAERPDPGVDESEKASAKKLVNSASFISPDAIMNAR
jgi:hypothetical protein